MIGPTEWARRADGAILCPNCRRWTFEVDPHLSGLCKPPDERSPRTIRKELFATAHAADIERIREALERGGQLTKEVAHQTLHIPERRFRAAVSELRVEGYPVVSDSEKGSTYRKALDDMDLEDFIVGELDSRAKVLLAQIRAMRSNRRRWMVPLVKAEQTKLL